MATPTFIVDRTTLRGGQFESRSAASDPSIDSDGWQSAWLQPRSQLCCCGGGPSRLQHRPMSSLPRRCPTVRRCNSLPRRLFHTAADFVEKCARSNFSGEAYFDVVSAERPFRVVTFNAMISVVGTAFLLSPPAATPYRLCRRPGEMPSLWSISSSGTQSIEAG